MRPDFDSFLEEIKSFFAKYPTPEDVIEDSYLKSLVEAYQRIKSIDISKMIENQIRNLFVEDFKKNDPLKTEINSKNTILGVENQAYTINEARTDIELHNTTYKFCLVLECKRLFFADQKYIKDGLKRFIELKYAEKENFAGMIGFILNGKPEKIVENLKKKVKNYELVANSEHLLKLKCANHPLSFQSKHIRIDNSEIHIYHLFFDFTS